MRLQNIRQALREGRIVSLDDTMWLVEQLEQSRRDVEQLEAERAANNKERMAHIPPAHREPVIVTCQHCDGTGVIEAAGGRL
jgi:hypothetical protein